jgi:hypothetical protein
MSADQVAEIAPLVREVLNAANKEATGSEWCATFEVVGNSAAWAQVTASVINVSYPHRDEPYKRLEGILSRLPDAHIVSWEPGQYATFSYGPATAMVIAQVVDEALTLLFQLPDYSVDSRVERL